jgi:hypothetical protein
MKKIKFWVATVAICSAGLVLAQRTPPPPVLMDDDGSIIAAHRSIHRHRGETVNWGRQTAGQRTWYVNFGNGSPCQEGAEFGHDRSSTCTISVACNRPGDAACKSYPYSSATAANAAQHDPEIVVDPGTNQ